ncbi:MAG: hypothetical protein ACT4OQ_07235 [Chloroflexota bacterium]
MRTPIMLLFAIVLAACSAPGTDIPVDGDDTPPASAAPGTDPVLVIAEGEPGDGGLSVADALGHLATDDLVSVAGALFVGADGDVLLCDAVAESFPPQCGGARIAVEGLDLSTIEGLQEENGVRWAESVVLFGSVE